MNAKEFFQSKGYGKLIAILGGLLIALLIFAAGVSIGYRQASFSYHWQNNYGPSFADPMSPFAPFMRDGDDLNPHGTFGDIISFKAPYLLVKGPNQAESIVSIGSETIIRNIRSAGTTTDLMPGQRVVIIGTPDDNGHIQASFIRVIPPPPNASDTPYSSQSIHQ